MVKLIEMSSNVKVIPVEIIREFKDSPNVQLRSHGKPPIVDSVKRRSRTDVSPSESKRTSLLITHDDGTQEWQNTETTVVTTTPNTKVEDLKIEEIGKDTLSRITRNQIDTPAISKVRIKESNIAREVLSPEVITIDVGDMNSPLFLRDTNPLSPTLEIYSLPNSPSPPPIYEESEIESDNEPSASTPIDTQSNKYKKMFPSIHVDEGKESVTNPLLADIYMCPKTPESTPMPSPRPDSRKVKDSFDSANCYINEICPSKESLANYPIPSPLSPPSRSISEISWIPDLESPSLLHQNTMMGEKHQAVDLKEDFTDNESRGQTNEAMTEQMTSYMHPNNPCQKSLERENRWESSKYKDKNFNLVGSDSLKNSPEKKSNDYNKPFSSMERHLPTSDKYSTEQSDKLHSEKIVRVPIEVKIINRHTPSTLSSTNQSGTKRDSYKNNQDKTDFSKEFQDEENQMVNIPVRIIPISLSDGKVIKQNESFKYDDFIGSELTGDTFNKSWSNLRETNIIGCEESQTSSKPIITSKVRNDQDKIIPIIVDHRNKLDQRKNSNQKSESNDRRSSTIESDNKPFDTDYLYRKQSLQESKLMDREEQANKLPTELNDSKSKENLGEQRTSKYRKISNTEEIITNEVQINSMKPFENENAKNIYKNTKSEKQSSPDKASLQKSEESRETQYPSKRVINIPIQVEGKLESSKSKTLTRSQTVEEKSEPFEKLEPFEFTKPQNLRHVHDELLKAQGKLAAQVSDLKTEIGRKSRNLKTKPAKLISSLRSKSVEFDQGYRHNKIQEEKIEQKSNLNHERSLQDINKDIETIWKELKGLEKLPVTDNKKVEEPDCEADDPLPDLTGWDADRQFRKSERARNRKEDKTKQQRSQSVSGSRTIWDSPSEPSKTSSIPIHFSFLPKSTETKPGSITSSLDSKVKVPSSPTRTIPINKQSSTFSQYKHPPSKQSPDKTTQTPPSVQSDKLLGKQNPDILENNKISKRKESSKERETTVTASPLFMRKSRELVQNRHDTKSEEVSKSNSPIRQSWKTDSTCQSRNTTMTSLKSCLKSESRFSDSIIDQSPLSAKSSGVNFMAEPTIKTYNSINNVQFNGQDQSFHWLKGERENGSQDGTTSSSHHTNNWTDFESSQASNYEREVPIHLTNQCHQENQGHEAILDKEESPNEKSPKEESPVSYDDPIDIIKINPSDYCPCDVSTQTEISVKHKNCCLM